MIGIVHGVDEYAPSLRCLEHLLIDVTRRRRHDIPGIVDISGFEGSPHDRHTRLLKFRSNHGSNHRNARSVCEQAGEFARGHTTTANEKNSAIAKLQEDRIHENNLSYAVTPCGETTRSKSDSARPILTGRSTRSAMISAVL